MNHTSLLLSTIFAWLSFLASIYVRFIQLPKWFANPPASFELLEKDRKNTITFWFSLSALFFITAFLSLIFNWSHHEARTHIIGAIVCFVIADVSGSLYFIPEINAFSKMFPNSETMPELEDRMKRWRRWSMVRVVLLFIAAAFISIAFNHV